MLPPFSVTNGKYSLTLLTSRIIMITFSRRLSRFHLIYTKGLRFSHLPISTTSLTVVTREYLLNLQIYSRSSVLPQEANRVATGLSVLPGCVYRKTKSLIFLVECDTKPQNHIIPREEIKTAPDHTIFYAMPF